ncbi:MAG: hypothetical protein IJ071_04675 [Ruminococcus sp.]|nr:hypothetical protein [Ruminococcus sp.]
MKDNILYDDNLQGNMLNDLQAMLDEALAAPVEERDFDSIAEITAAITEIAGGSISDETVSARASETAEQVVSAHRRRRISRVVKWAAALSACFALSLSLNLYSFTTFGVSAVEAAVRIVQNGFSVDLSKETYESEFLDPSFGKTITGQPPYESDPGDGLTASVIGNAMLDNCLENGFFPCYPKSDLPVQVELTDFEYKEQQDSQDFYFTFTGEDVQLDIIVENYGSKQDIPEFLIPSARSNYSTYESGVIRFYLFEEEDLNTTVFNFDSAVYTIVGRGIERNVLVDLTGSFAAVKEN